MISDHWPLCVKVAIRILALLAGIGAAIVGWYAARLWLRASVVSLPPYDPPIQSASDYPAIHTLSTDVRVNTLVDALKDSARLNGTAARWTAIAAMLTGLATVLSIV